MEFEISSRSTMINSDIDVLKDTFNTIMTIAVDIKGDTIRFIDNPTEEQILSAIKQAGSNIQYVNNPTKEMYEIAVNNDPTAIQFLKIHQYSYFEIFRLFNIAIEKDPSMIKYAFEHFNDYDRSLYETLCEKAFDIAPSVFKYFHEPTLKMIYDAIKYDTAENVKYLSDERFNPSDLISRQMYAIRNNAFVIQYINQTYELCLAAVEKSGLVLEYVDPCYKTEKMCFVAVNNCSYAFKYVPSECLSYRICVKALEYDDNYIRNIFLKGYKDTEVYSYFIKNCPNTDWKELKNYTKKINFKISLMSMLKTLGFWKINTKIRDIDN